MNYHEQSQVAAVYPHPHQFPYPHSYPYPHPYPYPPNSQFEQPQSNPNLNPISSFDQHQHQHQSSVYVVAPPELTSSYSLTSSNGATTQTTAYGGATYDVTNAAAAYYQHPNWVDNASLQVYGSIQPPPPPVYSNANGNILLRNGAQQFVTSNFDQNLVTNQAVWHQRNISNSRKHLKKTIIPLSVRCEVCKIVCDTQDVLDKHRLGKKHKKNLEKLKAVVAGTPNAAVGSINSAATSVEEASDTNKPMSELSNKKKASPHSEELETKKRKIVDCGAAIESVRMCSVCNIVCNSETVFKSHLAGQKHASMLKKQAIGTQQQSNT